MVTEQLYCRNVLCGFLSFIWLWLLVVVMKRCAERYALELHRTSLSPHFLSSKILTYRKTKLNEGVTKINNRTCQNGKLGIYILNLQVMSEKGKINRWRD